jgi:NAD+ synthase
VYFSLDRYNIGMSLQLSHPQQTIDDIVAFLQKTFSEAKKTQAVIAVSGGIDSALSLTLLTRVLPKEQITVFHLPYKDQSIEDSQTICDFHQIPKENQHIVNISEIVDAAVTVSSQSGVLKEHRKGSLMARARMMVIFDYAKALNALVCGTENKSEHYLGYFTRFGDAASDIEPICRLYKTQVRQLVEFFELPEVFLKKAPSAGLWHGQTDEGEMGFTYVQADQVLEQFIDQKIPAEKIVIEGVSPEVVQKVVQQVRANAFKLVVPYVPEQ